MAVATPFPISGCASPILFPEARRLFDRSVGGEIEAGLFMRTKSGLGLHLAALFASIDDALGDRQKS